jgi:hypothetical protein
MTDNFIISACVRITLRPTALSINVHYFFLHIQETKRNVIPNSSEEIIVEYILEITTAI